MNDTPVDPEPIPVAISNDETIVRAVVAPAHVHKKTGEVKKQAWRPPAGKSDLSVIRQLIGDDFCKSRAASLGSDKATYQGLLTVRASSIRALGSEVRDSRQVYLGHADLDHGFPHLPENDPASSPDELKRMDDRCRALLEASKYHKDPSPGTPGWAGPALRMNDNS